MSNEPAAGGKNYFFFLSYFHRDAKENVWFKQFYEDLTRDIAVEANIPVDTSDTTIRFFDREGIQTGDRWDATLVEALQTSRVFVPVYSKGYFKSEYCGKEFRFFLDRVREYEKGKGLAEGGAPLIIPILWGKPCDIKECLPKAIKDISWIQFEDESLGSWYSKYGLEYLIRMGTSKESQEYRAYQQFLLGIRERIVARANNHPTMPRASKVLPLEQVCSAFLSETPTGVGVVPAAGAGTEMPTAGGPEVACFVYVAGSPADFNKAKIQRSLTCYGATGGFQWQPYLPSTQKKIGIIANAVASEKEVYSQQLALSDRFIEQLREAEKNNTIVVLIIDPWSLQLYQESLSAYDESMLANCGAIVLWNDNDDETRLRRETLQKNLKATFSRNMISRDVFFRQSSSESDLRVALAAAIDDVYRRVDARAKLVRGPILEDTGPMPKLPVPSGASTQTSPAAPVPGGAQ